MKVVLVVGIKGIELLNYNRDFFVLILESINCNFSEPEVEIYLANDVDLKLDIANLKIKTFITEDELDYISADKILLFYVDFSMDHFLKNHNDDIIFTISEHGRILPFNRKISISEYPYISTHIFNKLDTSDPEGGFYYFPYGYLFRYLGMGRINEYGFRVPEDLEKLKLRDKSHILILVFGGSAAWSMYSLEKFTFQKKLEMSLNAEFPNNRFTVLNFGMHGNVVLNETLNYILHCIDLKPDFVVAHDGWNDFLYGLLTDKFMLNKSHIVYQYNLEIWAKMIKGNFDVKLDLIGEDPKTLPHNIIQAYVQRKMHFQKIVTSTNSRFIWALQPSIFSLSSHTKFENEVILKGTPGIFKKAYPKVKQIYEIFYRTVDTKKFENYIDFDSEFKKLERGPSFFGDHIHTLPKGDEAIANIYFEHFKNLLSKLNQL